MSESPNGKVLALQIAFAVISSAALGLSGWMLQDVVEMHSQLAEVRGNRFTSADGLQVWKEIARLENRISSIPTEIPPAWVVKRMDRMDKRLERLEARVLDKR